MLLVQHDGSVSMGSGGVHGAVASQDAWVPTRSALRSRAFSLQRLHGALVGAAVVQSLGHSTDHHAITIWRSWR
ncbi:hypothetical protein G7Y41_01420 [Schaalia sp. ZJ405]|uniref:hypothetical protein n=1 Tax=Schaalia sp. ZJ405 TaxID=2709403 RepID=UPI0018C950A3|nr:hypothetical protein [Schaalia sp. ZJ405]QPK81543.1 hypothetical protein G7Y41_01420 [Schaalia sp. ZJ405]